MCVVAARQHAMGLPGTRRRRAPALLPCPAAHSALCARCPFPPPRTAAINANGDRSPAPAEWDSTPLVVGAPLPPTVTLVQGAVGRLTVSWSAPALNADLETSYTLSIYDVTPGERSPADGPIEGLPLTASPTTIPFLVAGTKRVQITATNVNAGPTGLYAPAVKSALADEADVALATAPGIPSEAGLVGSTAGANISVTAPAQVSTAALNKFLIQVRGFVGCSGVGNTGCAGQLGGAAEASRDGPQLGGGRRAAAQPRCPFLSCNRGPCSPPNDVRRLSTTARTPSWASLGRWRRGPPTAPAPGPCFGCRRRPSSSASRCGRCGKAGRRVEPALAAPPLRPRHAVLASAWAAQQTQQNQRCRLCYPGPTRWLPRARTAP